MDRCGIINFIEDEYADSVNNVEGGIGWKLSEKVGGIRKKWAETLRPGDLGTDFVARDVSTAR